MARHFGVLLHRGFGLFSALFLFIAGATGAVIAWDHELDAWLNPTFFSAATPGEPQSAFELARAVEASDPRVQIRYLELGAEPGKALDLFVAPRTDPVTGRLFEVDYDQVTIDPVSGEIRGRREWGKFSLARENLVPFLYRLHYSLHLPQVGGVDLGTVVMGSFAVAWVADSLVSIWIAFPRFKAWRRSFAFRWAAGGHRLRFDLHRSGGVWLLPLLLMMAVTSVSMNLEHEVMRPLVSLFSAPTPSPRRELTAVMSDIEGPRLTLEQAVALANTEGRRRGWTQAAGGISVLPTRGLYSVGFFPPGGAHGSGLGPAWLHLDDRSGAIVGATVPDTDNAGDLFLKAMFPLHSGRILGTTGRVITTLLGAAIATLAITGITIWARRRHAKSASPWRAPRRPKPVQSTASPK